MASSTKKKPIPWSSDNASVAAVVAVVVVGVAVAVVVVLAAAVAVNNCPGDVVQR